MNAKPVIADYSARFTLLTLIAIGGCSAATQSTEAVPEGMDKQYLAPPCDIPGLTQDQYRVCVLHNLCEAISTIPIRDGERMPNDPRTNEEYEQCVKTEEFDLQYVYWVLKP